MADQTLAQANALKEPIASKPNQQYTLGYKFAWWWAAARCWARYLLLGQHRGVPGLVEFVLGNHCVPALQCGVLASRYCLAWTPKIIGRLSA